MGACSRVIRCCGSAIEVDERVGCVRDAFPTRRQLFLQIFIAILKPLWLWNLDIFKISEPDDNYH